MWEKDRDSEKSDHIMKHITHLHVNNYIMWLYIDFTAGLTAVHDEDGHCDNCICISCMFAGNFDKTL